MWAFQFVFFLVSLVMFVLGIKAQTETPPKCLESEFSPQWSPVLEAVKNTGFTTRFDGSFATPNAFKGAPSPATDEAWNNITYAGGKNLSPC